MRGIKVPQQDFALKIPGGLMREGGGGVYLQDTMVYIHVHSSRYSHVHVRLLGSGVHIPLDVQVAVILVDGTNIGLHLKCISAPSVVF